MFQSIGQQLRQAREMRHLSLEQVTRAIHIRVHYLQALEAGNLEAMPSEVQARGFLRAYAEFLGLDLNALLADTAAETPIDSQPGEQGETLPEIEAGLPPGGEIFLELGEQLRRRREMLGFSIEEVRRHTHLQARYLQALESGDLEGLPSPVQGRGMLTNYANFLGLDPEPLLLRYADVLQAGLQARQAEKQAASAELRPRPARQEARRASLLRRIFSGELIVVSVIVVFLVVASVWAAVRVFSMQSSQPVEPTAPSIAEVLLATATETLTPTPLPSTPTVPVFIPPAITLPTGSPPPQGVVLPTGSSGIQVYVTIRHRAWLRSVVDGEIEFEGRVLPGSAYAFAGEERVELLTSDGAAVQVFFNQQDLGPIGLAGQVVNLVFTLDGMQTPTPTITVTPTETPRISPTPTYTPAP